jgi:DNA-binding transcriptional MerR regulator
MATSSTTADKSERAFRTISEAAEVVGVPQHVLRFWETRFPQLQPLKRGGNRRYYRPSDMALLETIRAMLHDQGLTIRGAKLLLAGGGEAPRSIVRATDPAMAPKAAKALAAVAPAVVAPAATDTVTSIGESAGVIDRAALRAIRDRLRYALAA